MRIIPILDFERATRFADQIAKLHPRRRRGFLDSMYAQIVRGQVAICRDALELIAHLLHQYQWTHHTFRLSAPLLPDISDGLPIEALATTYMGKGAGFQTFSMGSRVVNSGPGWEVAVPVCYFCAPTGDYELGQVLNRLPDGALPVGVVFGPQ